MAPAFYAASTSATPRTPTAPARASGSRRGLGGDLDAVEGRGSGDPAPAHCGRVAPKRASASRPVAATATSIESGRHLVAPRPRRTHSSERSTTITCTGLITHGPTVDRDHTRSHSVRPARSPAPPGPRSRQTAADRAGDRQRADPAPAAAACGLRDTGTAVAPPTARPVQGLPAAPGPARRRRRGGPGRCRGQAAAADQLVGLLRPPGTDRRVPRCGHSLARAGSRGVTSTAGRPCRHYPGAGVRTHQRPPARSAHRPVGPRSAASPPISRPPAPARHLQHPVIAPRAPTGRSVARRPLWGGVALGVHRLQGSACADVADDRATEGGQGGALP